MMCIMHQGNPYGYLRFNNGNPPSHPPCNSRVTGGVTPESLGGSLPTSVVSRMVGCHPSKYRRLLKELVDAGVASVDADGTIYSRRMVHDEHIRSVRREAGSQGGNPDLLNQKDNQGGYPPVPPPSSPSSSSSPSASSKKGTSCRKSEHSDDKIFPDDSLPMRLASHLRSCIEENIPNPRPANLQKWAAVIDRMIRLDKRDPDDIGYMIDWCQADEFWRTVILSATKLRDQWDQLYLKSKDDMEATTRERRRDELERRRN